MRVVLVIHNKGTPKSIAVLRSCGIVSVEMVLEALWLTQMSVIPESTSLFTCLEIVEERVICSNRTLCDERGAISPA